MILKLKNIQLSFTDSRGETFNLLNGVNLDVKRETVTALVGGNGTGKTTLFNVISNPLVAFSHQSQSYYLALLQFVRLHQILYIHF